MAAEAIKWLNGPLHTDSYLTARYLSDNAQPSAEPRSMRRVASGPADFTLGSVAARGRTGPPSHFRTSAGAGPGDVFGPYLGPSTPSARSINLDQPSPTDEWLALRSRSASARNQDHALQQPYSNYDSPAHLHNFSRRSSEVGAIGDLVSQMDLAARSRRDDGPRYGMFSKKAIPPDNRVYPDRIILGELASLLSSEREDS